MYIRAGNLCNSHTFVGGVLTLTHRIVIYNHSQSSSHVCENKGIISRTNDGSVPLMITVGLHPQHQGSGSGKPKCNISFANIISLACIAPAAVC